MVGRICPPPGWNRVKASENYGVIVVAPVTPVDTFLRNVIVYQVPGLLSIS